MRNLPSIVRFSSTHAICNPQEIMRYSGFCDPQYRKRYDLLIISCHAFKKSEVRVQYTLGFPHALMTSHALIPSLRARAFKRKYNKQDKKLWILEYNAPQLFGCLQFLYSGEVNKELFLNEKFNLILFFRKIVLFSSYLCKK